MWVRGYWPLREDRAISLPVDWVEWVHGRGRGDGDSNGHNQGNNELGSGRLLRSHGPVPGSSTSVKMFTHSQILAHSKH